MIGDVTTTNYKGFCICVREIEEGMFDYYINKGAKIVNESSFYFCTSGEALKDAKALIKAFFNSASLIVFKLK